ncbi:MAG: potassium transporter TrkG [Akkermansia sp.]
MSSLDIFFENCSAFATVGVSRGITPDLSGPSKYLLIVNMLAGRVGLFAFSLRWQAPLPEALPLSIRQNPVNLNIPL